MQECERLKLKSNKAQGAKDRLQDQTRAKTVTAMGTPQNNDKKVSAGSCETRERIVAKRTQFPYQYMTQPGLGVEIAKDESAFYKELVSSCKFFFLSTSMSLPAFSSFHGQLAFQRGYCNKHRLIRNQTKRSVSYLLDKVESNHAIFDDAVSIVSLMLTSQYFTIGVYKAAQSSSAVYCAVCPHKEA